jgi:hypothetical protein
MTLQEEIDRESNEIQKDSYLEKTDQKPLYQNLECLLNLANNLKMHEDNLSWMIFSIFWAANALLLVALFQNGDIHLTKIKWIVVPLFGILLSTTWFILENRILAYQIFYEDLVARLEKKLNIHEDFLTNKNNNIYYEKIVKGNMCIRAKPMLKTLPIFGVMGWVGIGLLIWIINIP